MKVVSSSSYVTDPCANIAATSCPSAPKTTSFKPPACLRYCAASVRVVIIAGMPLCWWLWLQQSIPETSTHGVGTDRQCARRPCACRSGVPGYGTAPSTWALHHPCPGLPSPDVSSPPVATCARRPILLRCHGGSRQNQTTDRGDILLSELTVGTPVKITSAVVAALAFSLAGAGSALADTTGADASGGGDF